ncbi:NADPH-dependent FMN reductase [Vulcanococcus limneticus Candia 3F8]|uniref:NADPH-dependent FMN reductase n=1 Tax=Vulcanococcus limneticus TaxID=2170428 RepID=UPI000B99A358|nr:NADPH-dependent FMN reductase [Vulcanococcus limneticus]MCP9793512.1 NADPH-dependent FMN reductase [Vulcanococcus limneticus MW73D5]MCP9895494.1 NADPH-dependent FMN reductase [Vulcanococcus limneticus Candia 3F8]MCP9898920.1 NADPH-dependent FMN reductase [Vulcanococcus limneticus Candia 3B3]
MTRVLLINGSPTAVSRSSALLSHARGGLEAAGLEVSQTSILDYPADDLVQARYGSDSFATFIEEVAAASGIIVSTPIYKASFSGGLKALLDILPQEALLGKAILPLASAGTISHLLAIDYALKPVLSVLGARDIEQGVFAVDDQFEKVDGGYTLKPELVERLDRNLGYLISRVQP